MEDQDTIRSANYLQRRIAATRLAQSGLSASMRYDLARSGMNDDELEDAVGAFGGPVGNTGFGLAEVFQELHSRQPKRTPVTDIKQLQQNLVEGGYVDPDTPVDGQWSPLWYSGFRRADRDSFDEVMSGKHFLATPVTKAVGFLANMLPSRVFQGIIGTAKGVVEQAPETASRVGAAGGAVAGAALGSVIPGAGTLFGAGVGATVGFLSDFLSTDPDETDQSPLDRFIDAITPLEEYTDENGSKRFFEDLGFVLSAAAMISGGRMAVGGRVALGSKSLGAEATAGQGVVGAMRGVTDLRSALARPGLTEPGWFSKVLLTSKNPLARGAVGGATGGGIELLFGGEDMTLESVGKAAALGAGVGALSRGIVGTPQAEAAMNFVRQVGPLAQIRRPAAKAIQNLYTGAVSANVGARATAGLGSGETETTLEKAQRKAPQLPEWTDALAWVIWPTTLAPVNFRAVGKTMSGMMGDVSAFPFLLAKQYRRPDLSLRKGMAELEKDFGGKLDSPEAAAHATHLRADFGVEMMAADAVNAAGIKNPIKRVKFFHQKRAEINRQLLEWGEFKGQNLDEMAQRHFGRRLVPEDASPIPDAEMDKVADDILRRTIRDKGATYKLHARTFDQGGKGQPGYWVSMGAPYRSGDDVVATGFQDFGEAMGRTKAVKTVKDLTDEDYLRFRAQFRGAMEKYQGKFAHENVMVGTYLGEGGKIYIDPAIHVGQLKEAKFLSAHFGQFGATRKADFADVPTPKNLEEEGKLAQDVMSWSLGGDDIRKGPMSFAAWLVKLKGRDRGLEWLPAWREVQQLNARTGQAVREGRLTILTRTGKVSKLSRGGKVRRVTRGAPTSEITATQSRIDNLTTEVANLRSRAGRSSSPGMTAELLEQAKLLETEVGSLGERLKVLKGQTYSELSELNVAPERLETWTRGDFLTARRNYRAARKEMLQAFDSGNPTALLESRRKMDSLLDDLHTMGGVDDELIRKARQMNKPPKQIEEFLLERAKVAAQELRLPDEVMAEYARLGYKPVATGEDMLFPAQMSQMFELMGVGDYTRRAAVWETLGLSPRRFTDPSLFRLRAGHETAELNQVFQKHGIALTGEAGRKRLYETLRDLNHEGVVVGPAVIPPKGGARFYMVDVRSLSMEDIYNTFSEVDGFTHKAAEEILSALKRGAALGGEAKLRHPMETLRSIGRATRVQGLPGFSDVMRTYRVRDPGKTQQELQAIRREMDIMLNDPEVRDLESRSIVHQRIDEALKETQIGREHRDFVTLMIDQLGRGAVKTGRFSSLDEFYRNFDLQTFSREAGPGDLEGMLLQRITKGAPMRKLREIAEVNLPEATEWYGSYTRIAPALFTGTTRAGGKLVNDYDLFTQFLAISSAGNLPSSNLTKALTMFEAVKRGRLDEARAVLYPSLRNSFDDIMRGNTMDTWKEYRALVKDPQTQKLKPLEGVLSFDKTTADRLRAGARIVRDADGKRYIGPAPAIRLTGPARKRPKITAFYRNLMGDMNSVTVDRRIKVMWGFHPEHSLQPKEYDQIAADIFRLSDDLSRDIGARVSPAQVQASIWFGFADHVEGVANNFYHQLQKARKAGNRAAIRELEDLSGTLDDMVTEAAGDSRSFVDLLSMPTEKQDAFISKLAKSGFMDMDALPTSAYLMSKVGSDIRGAAKFGEDFGAVVKLFRTADLDTFMHESGHIVRAMLPEDELRALEAAYGIEAPPIASPETLANPKYGDALKVKVDDLRSPLAREVARRAKTTEAYGPMPALYDGDTAKLSKLLGREVSENEVSAALDEIVAHTQRSLESRGLPEEFYVFRAAPGELGKRKGLVPASTEPGVAMRFRKEGFERGGFKAYRVRRSDVVVDSSAYADLGETELLIPFEKLREVKGPGTWSRGDEERFAGDVAAVLREGAKPSKQLEGPMAGVKRSLAGLWRTMRGEMTPGGEMTPTIVRGVLDDWFDFKQLQTAANLPRMRTIPGIPKHSIRLPAVNAALGGGLGAAAGDEPEDILRGAFMGAVLGSGLRGIARKNYGYLPDALVRMNTALRYSLSFTFDAGRYTEQNLLAMTKYGLPAMLRPDKYIKARAWKSPYAHGEVRGEVAWRDAMRLWDELNGTTWFQQLDDIDKRLFQAGILGFQPRMWEAAQAFQLYQRGWSRERIVESTALIGRYGVSRTAAEKSANFVFFPFSFSKKLITSLGDFLLQAPARAMLTHEGMKRFSESGLSEEVGDFLEKNVPLMRELYRINNLAFGLSPGRFFLQGLSDNRTALGTTMQALASVFAPSGAVTPLHQLAGGAGDLAINAFVPIVVTGESISRVGGPDSFADLVGRYVPFIRDLGQFWEASSEQVTAMPRQLGGEGAAPWSQFTSYQDERREAKEEYDLMGQVMGYTSADGLFNSPLGAGFAAQFQARDAELQEKYPTGFRMSQEFTNTTTLNKRALLDLEKKKERTEAEDAILELAERIALHDQVAEASGIPSTLANALTSRTVRDMATGWAHDQRFAELYDRIFAREYGPIRRVA